MLDYTRAIYDKTKKDLDTALTLFRFITQIIYIAYLIYLICVPNKIWYLHLVLLIISSGFFIFDIFTAKNINAIKNEKFSLFGKRLHNERLSRAKRNRKNVAKIKFYVSHVIKIFVLISAIYPIITVPETVHPISVMCTTAMVLLWILQIVFEVLRITLEGRGELFMEALKADVEFVTKPVNAVKNTLNKIIGREVKEESSPSKDRVYLDKLVEKNKNEKAAQKAASRSEKKERFSSWYENRFSKKGQVYEDLSEEHYDELTDNKIDELAVISYSQNDNNDQ